MDLYICEMVYFKFEFRDDFTICEMVEEVGFVSLMVKFGTYCEISIVLLT